MTGAVRVKRPNVLRHRSALIALGCLALLVATTFAADTIVFGPRTYNGNGRPVLDRRTFNVTDTSGSFTLRVTNRGVTDAFVALNGRKILRPSDFSVRFEHTRSDGRRPDGDNVGIDGRNDNRIDGGDAGDDRRDVGRREQDGRGPGGDPRGSDDRWEPEWDAMRRDGRNEDQKDRDDREVGRRFVPLLERSVTLRPGRNELVVGFRGRRGTSLTIEIVKKDSGAIDTTPPVISPVVSPLPNADGWNNDIVTVTFICSDVGSGVATCAAPAQVSAEGAGQVVTGEAVDVAGNMATTSVTANLDRTPPVVTATADPSPNANGWNNGPVTISFEATDALSGIAPGIPTIPTTLSIDGANQSATGQATDRAGNVGSVTPGGINIDQTRPSITVELSPAPNADGLYTGPVSAHFMCADAGSGIDTCLPDRVVDLPGADQTITGTATDRAGNSASATSSPFTIQPSGPPVITVTLTPASNVNGWNNTPVAAHFVCTPDRAPVVSCPPGREISTEGANQTVSGTAIDAEGHTASVTSDPFSIDLTRPTVEILLSPLSIANWRNVPVTAHFACTDALSGVAVSSPDQVLATDGPDQSASGSCTDRAGNTETALRIGINIDQTPPDVRITLDPPPNANDWNNSPVTAHSRAPMRGRASTSAPARRTR